MPKILAITQDMHSRAKEINSRALALQSSQNSMTQAAGSMMSYFSGALPELMIRKLSDMKKKHESVFEKITQYVGKVESAADSYDWSDQEIKSWAESLGVDEGALRNAKGPFTEGGGNWGASEWDSKLGERVDVFEKEFYADYYYKGNDGNTYNQKGECVWYARNRAAERKKERNRAEEKEFTIQYYMSGSKWWGQANKDNLPVGQEIKSDSIACFSGPSSNGHVIYVEEVSDDGWVYYTEANVDGGISDGEISPSDGVLKRINVEGFKAKCNGTYQGCIYLEK